MTKLVNANNLINCLQIMSTKNDSKVWEQCIEIVNSLPNEQKYGKWVIEEYKNSIDGSVYKKYRCSECSCPTAMFIRSPYCSNCGARMSEIKEGSPCVCD